SLREPRDRVALGEDTPAAAVLVVALPGDEEIAGGVHRDGGVHLVVLGGGADAELAALGHTRGIVALGVNAPAVAVLLLALPGNDEIAAGVHCDSRVELVMVGGGVNAELAADRVAGGVVALGVDTPAVAVLVLARPDHHEISGRICRNGVARLG